MCDFKGEIKIFKSDLRSYSCHKMTASFCFSWEKTNNYYMHISSTSLNGPHSCTHHPIPQTHPFWVTRHCRSPSLRKMSTTISMGVWSVTVKGLRSKMLCSLTAGTALSDAGGSHSVNRTADTLTTPSWCRRAFSEMIEWKIYRKNKKTGKLTG